MIHFLRLLLLVMLSALSAPPLRAAPPSLKQTIQAQRWKQRILLLAAPAAGDPKLTRQQALLAGAAGPLRERDILVLVVLYPQLSAADRRYLQAEIQLTGPGFGVVLIGKDGGVKRTENQPITPSELFATIDRMPMRRQEMRR